MEGVLEYIQTNYGAFEICLKFIFGKSYSPNILQIKMVIFIKKLKYLKIEIELPSLVLLMCQCPTMLFVALATMLPACSPGLVFPILYSALSSTHKDLWKDK